MSKLNMNDLHKSLDELVDVEDERYVFLMMRG